MDVSDYYGKGHGHGHGQDSHLTHRDFSRSGGPQSRQPNSPSPGFSPTAQLRRGSAPAHAMFGSGQRDPGPNQRSGAPRRADGDPPDSVNVAGTQAQSYFESMLRSDQGLDVGRREIVKSALGLVSKSTSQPADVDFDAFDDMDPDDYSVYPSAETLHSILHGMSYSARSESSC